MLSKSSNWISVLFTISQNSQYRGLLYQDLSVRPASFLPNITYTAQGVFYLTLSQSKRVVGRVSSVVTSVDTIQHDASVVQC